MDKGHQEVTASDHGFVSRSGGTVNRDVLAKEIVIADFEESFFALVFAVLGVTAQDCALGDAISLAHDDVAADRGMIFENAPFADDGLGFDNRKRPDLDVISDVSLGANEGGRVNVGHGLLGGLLDLTREEFEGQDHFGGDLTIDRCDAFNFADSAFKFEKFDFKSELITGDYLFSEFDFIDSPNNGDKAKESFFAEQNDGSGLGKGFDD
jgi:hypothetical protein